MSRAFVKELDDNAREAALPVTPQAPHHMTARGKAELEASVAAASGAERTRLERRLASAVVVPPPPDRATVAFGATVAVRDAAGRPLSFTLVGEHEVDIAAGRVAERSPVGDALLGHRPGDVVRWPRPIGDESLTIVSVEYKDFGTRDDENTP